MNAVKKNADDFLLHFQVQLVLGTSQLKERIQWSMWYSEAGKKKGRGQTRTGRKNSKRGGRRVVRSHSLLVIGMHCMNSIVYIIF